jgi:hypothetical protein
MYKNRKDIWKHTENPLLVERERCTLRVISQMYIWTHDTVNRPAPYAHYYLQYHSKQISKGLPQSKLVLCVFPKIPSIKHWINNII